MSHIISMSCEFRPP